MKVFLSWSGDKSEAVAKCLGDWLPKIIQNLEIFFSPRDVEKGAAWFSKIAADLTTAKFGVVVLSRENRDRPWILFEAGALAIRLEGNVCPILIDFPKSDLRDPLVHYNASTLERDDLYKLVTAINSAVNERPVAEVALHAVFSALWPQIEQELSRIIAHRTPPKEPEAAVTQMAMLKEILLKVQQIERSQGFDPVNLANADQQQVSALMTLRNLLSRFAYALRAISVLDSAPLSASMTAILVDLIDDIQKAVDEARLANFVRPQIEVIRQAGVNLLVR